MPLAGRNGELRDPLVFNPITVRSLDSPDPYHLLCSSVVSFWFLDCYVLLRASASPRWRFAFPIIRFLGPCHQCSSLVRFWFSDYPITRCPDHPIFCVPLPVYPQPARPHPLFFAFVANKALSQFDACVALGRRLGHPWATQGPPKPNPKQAEGRKRSGVCFG
jgi:hypothetical protein